MQQIVTDANILINALTSEEEFYSKDLTPKIVNPSLTIWAPAVLTFETMNAMGRKLLENRITPKLHDEVLETLYSLPLVLLWNYQLIKLASDIQKKTNLTLYDSSYLATAIIKDVPLITNDKELIKKGRKFHNRILPAEQWA